MTGPASLGLRTEILALSGLAEVTEYPDRIVVRTPSEPTYWFGNYVLFRRNRVDSGAIAQFRADFPGAAHVTLRWDVPGPGEGEALEVLRRAGFEIEGEDVLVARGPVPAMPRPEGYVLREIEGDADWAQVVDLQTRIGIEAGHDGPGHADYVRARYRNARAQIGAGLGARFGAFDPDGRLAADLGLFHDAAVGRYQNVATDPAHRRRGLCAALVSHAAGWARARVPDLPLVIIAEPEGDAGRIYRRCGFRQEERLVSALLRGY